ncbi:amidohydrolase family protein [Vannielia litorea]|uniref:amidohydrolase family protein n=1 Tax=Vannielia litorea TaxID=1217970 RepID=UPI001BCC4100|nr:amidohydrolase family protein [Vannielia litorea]MBS8224680.1 2-pyrone-4,6-dicarboxylate hydrolase [Vannielia litorea]
MTEFRKYDTQMRSPGRMPPAGTWDCQIHVFGDPEKYPVRSGAAYAPFADATIETALKMHEAIGVAKGVIVQSTVHGTDHSILYDGLARAGGAYRGVAIVNDTISDKELERLHEAGVRGARFNFWKQLNIAPDPDEFLRSLERIKPFGWHAKIHSAKDEWLDIKDLLTKIDIPVVIDHLGHPDLSLGSDQPAVRMLLDLLRNENWWVLVSNADRVSSMDRGYDDVVPLIQTYLDHAPDRALWCTDWPHVQYTKRMPDEAELLELLYKAVPDDGLLRKILVDNPEKFFGSST